MDENKKNNILIKPAQIILEDNQHKIKQLSVAKVLTDDKKQLHPLPKITNSGVYLISRGCVFEHLKSEFKPHKLDKQFTARNKKITRHLQKYKSINDDIESLKAKMSKETLTKDMKYKKKFASGKIIGL